MSENVYEGLYIFNSELYARNPDEVSGQIAKYIEDIGGEVLLSRLWDERRLAYSIKGHRRGTYWLSYFKIDPSKIKELSRLFQITESVLRFLFLKLDPRIVEAVVEHAKEGPVKPQGEEEINTSTTIGEELEEDLEVVGNIDIIEE
ncbi:MAG: 30S ribosomal protein S6 [Planctomycetaceae bacterium]|nr:30S ribosomal protein S6 [Planctomycetaceae bacterium]